MVREPVELLSAVRSLIRLRAAAGMPDALEAEIRRRTAEAARQHYQLLFERNLAAVFRSRRDGRVIECNEAFVRMLGYRSSQDAVERFVDLG